MGAATFASRPGRLPQKVIDALHCPMCQGGLACEGPALRCPSGHTFNLARQGYVNLLGGDMRAATADDPRMVQAREEFLAAGHYRGISELVAAALERTAPAAHLVLDAGAGTGHHLRVVLDRLPSAVGLALDLSAPAQRRSARASPRIGAVVWDIWRSWPVRSGVVDAVMNVFAPRNPAEFRRVLRPEGALVVVTPTADHLAEILPAGGVKVDPRKDERLAALLAPHFRLIRRGEHREELSLGPDDVERLLAMGPTAHHREQQAVSPLRATATASVVVSTYRPR